jgi:hypothetical protein
MDCEDPDLTERCESSEVYCYCTQFGEVVCEEADRTLADLCKISCFCAGVGPFAKGV